MLSCFSFTTNFGTRARGPSWLAVVWRRQRSAQQTADIGVGIGSSGSAVSLRVRNLATPRLDTLLGSCRAASTPATSSRLGVCLWWPRLGAQRLCRRLLRWLCRRLLRWPRGTRGGRFSLRLAYGGHGRE